VLAAFVLPLLAVLLGFEPARLVPFDGGWAGDAPEPLRAIEAFAAIQVAVFLIVLAILRYTPLGLALTPRGVRRDRVHREAMAQFLSQGMHVTEARTGVLLYVSLPDHVAEVIADAGIYAKVAPETWGETVAAITDGARSGDLAGGFVRAIGLAGEVLAQHFPPTTANPNELPDRLIEV
jgi:putative membrane protein